jgi:hypothetical protein
MKLGRIVLSSRRIAFLRVPTRTGGPALGQNPDRVVGEIPISTYEPDYGELILVVNAYPKARRLGD